MKLRIDDNDLVGLLNNAKLNRTGQYVANCPFCGKESHFYVSQKKQAFDCKKCGVSGGIYKLLKHFNKTYLLQGSTVEIKDEIKSLKTLIMESEEETSEADLEPLPEVKLPAGSRRLKRSEYLEGRGLSREELQRYEFYESRVMRKNKGYVFIPVRDGGVVRGYVGRWGDKIVPDGKLRYNNSLGTPFGELLYGYDEIVKGETELVVLVEGIFDKIAVDRVLDLHTDNGVKCVCTFGKKISDKQIRKLLNKDIESVILLYDFDAVNDMKRYCMELDKYFKTKVTFTTKKDIDECTEEEALEVFNNLLSPREFCLGIAGKLKK